MTGFDAISISLLTVVSLMDVAVTAAEEVSSMPVVVLNHENLLFKQRASLLYLPLKNLSPGYREISFN